MGASTFRTKMSTKGQVILPKAIRDEKRWPPGTEFQIEVTDKGVHLSPKSVFPPTRHEDVFGMLKPQGRSVTIEEMDDAIVREVQRRHALGRY